VASELLRRPDSANGVSSYKTRLFRLTSWFPAEGRLAVHWGSSLTVLQELAGVAPTTRQGARDTPQGRCSSPLFAGRGGCRSAIRLQPEAQLAHAGAPKKGVD
jgi:hypothetical protein